MNGKVKLAISLLTIGSCTAASPAAEALELMPLIRQIQEAGVPLIIGEYGATKDGKFQEAVRSMFNTAVPIDLCWLNCFK